MQIKKTLLQTPKEHVVIKNLDYWKKYIVGSLNIRELNVIIEEFLILREFVWEEILKRKTRDKKERHYWLNHMSFYMKFPEIRESAWRVFMNEAKKDISIYNNLIGIYFEVPKFRMRIANRIMKQPENVSPCVLCFVVSDLPKFRKKVIKEFIRRYFNGHKLTRRGKSELLLIVGCDRYAQKLKLWAAKILLKEKLYDMELCYIHKNVPKMQV